MKVSVCESLCVSVDGYSSVYLSIQPPSLSPSSFRRPHTSFCPPWRQLEVAGSEDSVRGEMLSGWRLLEGGVCVCVYGATSF